jgi:amino acid adenylation domain-containing protein/non-ribosomal peptide synthase protein (TIGR01720 family)
MISDVYKLTPMQLGMLFHSLLDKESTAYFEHFLFSLKGEVDYHLLEKSFNALIERYDILRTIFHIEDKDQPLQIVLKQRKSKVYFKNIDHLSREEQEQYVQDFMAKDKKRGFDLTRDMLMRLSLLKTGKDSYKLIWSFHHILMDGWCLGIIFKELSRVYYSLKTGETIKLEPVTPYAYYIKWLQSQDKEQGLKYWREYLEGYEEPTNMEKFGTGESRGKSQYQVETYTFGLDKKITTDLQRISAAENTTINTLMQTLWGLLLQRYHNIDDVVYGAVVSGRPPEVPGIEKMVGLFINTVPVRITTGGEKTFPQLIQNVQKKAALTKSYEYLPLSEIQAQSTLKNQLIDHIMVFENYPIEQQVKNNDDGIADKGFSLEVQNVKAYEQTNYHFNIIVSPGKRLFINFNFNSLLFDMEFIKRIARHFNNLVNQVAENLNIFLEDIEIVTPEEKYQILFEFNETRLEIPLDKTIHELFAAQVEQTPDYIAVSGSLQLKHRTYMTYMTYISYRELNKKSQQLSHLLKEKGVNPNTIAAIIAGHSIEMIVGILGILKAGGAYLPIDPKYPAERINYMLKDSNVGVLMTTSKLQVQVKAEVKENSRTLPQLPLQFIDLETRLESAFELSPSTLTLTSTCQVSPANLAYVIYTSGSTGKPKGVIVEHQSLVNLCCWHNYNFSVTYKDRASKYAGFGFDASVWEIFPYIIRGASLYIIEDQIKLDIPRLNQYFEKHHITISFLPTQVCEQFMAIDNRSLRMLLTGGDKLKRFVKQDYCLVNNYGPTEDTVVATSCIVEQSYQVIPIGKPISNNWIYILSKHGNLQPVGIPGELCIAGDSLARGYLNHPELTAERFFSFFNKSYKSYRTHISRRVYRTGDLAQWLPDGNILFIGRTDQQVKIRGYRIELGEIEHQLLNVNTIKQAVVLTRENKPGEKYLCAYIVPDNPLEDSNLRETLSRHLPDYMIPSYFIQLEKLPLTPNGKIDPKALPEPAVKTGEDGYQPPRDDVEKKLAKIWAEVLLSSIQETNPISINDNFFNIGGDSIKAIQIAARLKKFGLKLEIKDLFANPTIKQLRKTITPIKRAIDQGPVCGEVQLTPIQQWFFENNFDHRHHFNQAVMIYRQEGFNENIVRQVFQQLIRHHDALRMVYQLNHETPKSEKVLVLQINRDIDENAEGKLLDLELFDFKKTRGNDLKKEIQKEANRIQQGIDLGKGPLVKLALFKTDAGDHLMIIIHHLVVDGISWRILLEDFALGYQQVLNDVPLRFPPKTDSFKQWAQRLKTYAESPALLNQLEYWKHIEKTSIPPLPEDFKISPAEKKIKNLRSLRLTLNPEQTRQLLKEVNQAYSTEINDILLAAVGLAVKDWAGIDKVFINLEGHGRQEIIHDTDISRTVGWFTCQYPVLLEMNPPRGLSYTIKHIKETLRQIPKKGIGYGILKYLTPADKKDEFVPRQTPGISFNYMGEFGSIGQLHQENMFNVSEMPTGYQFSPELEQWYTISINGIITQSQLVLDFSYNKFQYKSDIIDRLLEGCKTHLLNIISHCVKKETKELTPSDLTYPHLSIDQLEAFTHQFGDINDIYELTPMQTGMLFHALKDKESTAYFEQMVFSIKGDIDKNVLQESLNRLVERYDILRTVFYYEGVDQPLQIVLQQCSTNIYFEDIAHLNKEAQTQYLKEFYLKDREKGFDLTGQRLIRASLIKTGNHSYQLVWSFHHILMDGWCTGIIFNELTQIYNALLTGEPLKLEPVTQYVDYIKWLNTRDKQEGLEYWQEYQAGYESPAGLTRSGTRAQKILNNDNIKYELGEYVFRLEELLTDALMRTAVKNNVTINTVIQTIWGILLQRYNQTDDVVYGVVVSGRPPELEEVERMIGLFINTVPVRIQAHSNTTFSQLLHQVQQNASLSKSYEYLPLTEIQSLSFPKGELIDHIMVFENYPIDTLVRGENKTKTHQFKVEDVQTFEQTNYHFNIIVIPGKRMVIQFTFNVSVYEKDSVKRISEHFTQIVKQVTVNPLVSKREIEIIPELEKQRLLYEFNDTYARYPQDKTIHGCFIEQVEQTPDNIAVVGPLPELQFNYRTYKTYMTCISYDELNEKSNQLAVLLREKGVKPDTIVGIMMDRSIEMIIGSFGILKAGGTYMPIDPEYPHERITYMLKDSGAKILLKHNDLTSEAFNNCPKGTSSHLHLQPAPATSLAYIIYTSGSTGKPKGVTIEHVSVVNLLSVLSKKYPLSFEDTYLLKTSYTFDVSVTELFGWFWGGGRTVILEKGGEKEPLKILDTIERTRVTHINFVPSMFAAFLEILKTEGIQKLSHLKYIFLAGEAVLPGLVKKFIQLDSGVVLENLYGPTEATIYASQYSLSEWNGSGDIPIGKPLANLKLYILDRYDHLQPLGVAGELCISGIGLARGYLNRPGLTAERFCLRRPGGTLFVKNAPPGPPRKNFLLKGTGKSNMHPIYRTGDLARWLPDGNIEFLGRIDHQVKIRGYRIELGEIENQLMTVTTIKEAVVLARENKPGEKYLCAYIVPAKPLGGVNLRETLSQHLPDYMIPLYFIQLEKLPLTNSGKIDQRALPEPGIETPAKDYQAPRDNVEVKLAEIWAEVLLSKQALEAGTFISINDNFLTIGGDSIKAIQIAARLHRHGLKLEIKELFEYPTIKQLRKCIKQVKRTIDQGPVKGEVQLIPFQQWFFENNFTHPHHFNQAVMIYRQEGFDEYIVKRVFQKLTEHHDALRMVYERRTREGVVIQWNRGIDVNGEGKLFDIDVFDFKQAETLDIKKKIENAANKIQAGIRLETGPLVKLGLFKTSQGDHLLIVIHHLVVDGVSWRILLEDFAAGYHQAMNHETLQFPPKTDSFKQWASRLKQFAESHSLLSELEYWNRIEKTAITPLPKDFETLSAEKKIKNNRTLQLILDPEETRQLLTEVNQPYSTEINDILLAALGLAVKKWAGIEDVFIHMEGHGREEILEDIDITRTVGWFTSQFPVLLEMKHSGDLSYIIKHVKETLRRIPNKGIGYGILRYLTPANKKEGFAPAHPPEIIFNYLGEFAGFNQEHQENVFQGSEMKTGNPLSPECEQTYTININGMILQSQLVLSLSYNKKQYKPLTIEELVNCFKTHLLTVISHCVKKERKELTPSDLTYPHLSIEQLDTLTRQMGEIKDIYELTPMQAGMLFHTVKEEQSAAYVEQMIFSIKGEIEKDLLQKSFNMLVERYDILRTLFYYEQVDQPLQIVLRHRPADIYFEDIAHLNKKVQKQYLKGFYLKDRQKGFDLFKDNLIRLLLLKTGEDTYQVVLTFHHILMDGWCIGIIFKELSYIYQCLKRGEPVNFDPIPQYNSYIRWLKRQHKEEGLNYWQAYLEGYEDQTSGLVPTFEKQEHTQEARYIPGNYPFTVNQTLTGGLNRLAQENQVTLNTIIQTLWGILLQRYNNTNDVVFGAVVSGRPPGIDGIEQMVGLFINTIPVRIKSNSQDTFSQLIKAVQSEAVKAKSYEYLPLAEIQANSFLKSELIRHIIAFENYPIEKEIKNTQGPPIFNVRGLETYAQTNYDFNIAVVLGTQLSIEFLFNSLLYKKDFVEQISIHLKYLIEQIIENPDIEEREIEIIPVEEKQRLLAEFNNTASVYPKDKTLQQIFAEQVKQTPDHIAVIGSSEINYKTYMTYLTYISYGELNQKSDQLAHVLRERGVKPDTIVAIMMERCLEMIIGLLGILKAGGAYLPIDPGSPEERINYMLKDSNAQVLVVNDAKCASWLSFAPAALLNLSEGHHLNFPASQLPSFPASLPSSLAYVIYTSGTSGKPKGTLITHANVIRVVKNTNYIELTGNDRILQLSNYAFDGSVFDIYGALLNGAVLVLVDRDRVFAVDQLSILIRQQQITVFFVTTALFNILIDTQPHCFTDVRKVLFGGEQVSLEHSRKALQYMGKGRVIHVYGPTETTVFATYYFIDRIEEKAITVPIGMPIANTTAFILDKYDRLAPVGVTGELVVGGDGVARGYLNNPELTDEKFKRAAIGHSSLVIKNLKRAVNSHLPLVISNSEKSFPNGQCPMTNDRLYRTGDLGRWLADGAIEFLGRRDFQVKIRGFRIEPGEIENRLLQHPQVREAVVITRQQPGKEPNEKYLCAYIVPKGDQKPEPADFRKYLAGQLPDYMVPAYFVLLEKIPLTSNGKVQRNALPEPTLEKRENYTAPRNIIEKKLAAIWGEILCRDESIGVNDNFFELGGHSLRAAVLAAKIHQVFQVKIPLKQIFSSPTIKDLAAAVAQADKNQYIEIEKIKESDFYEPSYHQKRLWILNQLSPGSHAFHMPGNLVLNHEVNEQAIKKAVSEIVRRHESFRTGFKLLNDQPMQFILNKIELPLQFIDISTMPENEKQRERDRIYEEIALKPFQLDQPPLFRSVLVKSGPRHYQFMFNVHHIISDGWSMEILKRDFHEIYDAYRKGKEVTLLPLGIQYKDFAAMNNKKLMDPVFKKEAREFWKKKLQNTIPILKFHGSLNKNPGDKKGAGYQCFIDTQLKGKLQKIAKANNTSLFMVMFSVYILFLARFTGEQDIACSFISAGREHVSLHNIIGFFVNSVIFRTRVDDGQSFESFLRRINNDILEIFEYQSYPLELLFEEMQMRYPDIPVSFNMTNIQDATVGRELRSPQPAHAEKAQDVKFDLEPYINEYKNGIHIYWAYRKNLFTPKTIEYMASEYIKLLDYFATHPNSDYKTYRDRGIKPTFKRQSKK